MLFTNCRRRAVMLSAYSLSTCALLAASAHLIAAEPATFPELIEQAKQAEGRGSTAEAERFFQNALSLLKNAEVRDAVVLWNDLGHIHQKQRRFSDAEHDFLTALNINARLQVPDLGEKASSLNNLGILALQQGQLPQAEERLQQALGVLDSAGLSDSATGGLVLENLGQICFKQHKYDAARDYYRKAENIISRTPGPHSIEYAKLLVATGLLSFETADYADALAKDNLALEIESQLTAVVPSDKATVENNLALVFMHLGEASKAEELLTDAVKLYTSGIADPDLRIIEALNSLASTQMQLDKLDAAKEHADHALKLAVQVAGADSEQAAKIHNTLGCLHLRHKKWSAARAEFEQALQLWAKIKGDASPEYAATLTDLGSLDRQTRNHKRAEAEYRAALRIDEAVLGPNHPRVADDLSNVAAELFTKKQWDAALQLYDRARLIQEKSFGPQSLSTARTWRNIAFASASSKRFDDAAQAYTKAVGAFEASPASTGQEFGFCLREYANVLRVLQRFNEAERADLLATRIEVRNAITAERGGTAVSTASSFR